METLEAIQARHRKEKKELQGRVTNKKKNTTKKTRKGVNEECAELERQLAERHASEIAAVTGSGDTNKVPEKTEDAGDEAGDVADQIAKATIEDAAEAAGEAGTWEKAQPAKERLARRAAEQAALAEAAESETVDMVDHKAIERAAMEGTFRAHSLLEREIRPDGHCLFSAVADQLEQDGIALSSAGKHAADAAAAAAAGKAPGYKVVRAAAAGWIEDHADDFAPFLEEDVASYAAKMRDTAEWGGQVELMALANAYGVRINVVQNGATEKIQPSEGGDDGDDARHIWLAYYRHGYGLGEHYNSLRKAR
ncbi:unnamed protein product [Parascedosporium putredinis]|uniref:OTU domain-containing protein n=1 Tax=Parascedosporium putredinis TaxID=1442378 RepID=A0A9P1H3C8_9PEZI|nr:unnamed protein product [Parascedosporium putredinis]CAI7995632.1 unnamed protein product [Parascedosporium putredinis]